MRWGLFLVPVSEMRYGSDVSIIALATVSGWCPLPPVPKEGKEILSCLSWVHVSQTSIDKLHDHLEIPEVIYYLVN